MVPTWFLQEVTSTALGSYGNLLLSYASNAVTALVHGVDLVPVKRYTGVPSSLRCIISEARTPMCLEAAQG